MSWFDDLTTSLGSWLNSNSSTPAESNAYIGRDNGANYAAPDPNSSKQPLPSGSTGDWLNPLFGGAIGLADYQAVAARDGLQAAESAASATANELATAYDWGKQQIRNVANSFETGLDGAANAAAGVGLLFLVGAAVVAYYVFSKRDVIIEGAAKGAGAAAVAGA